MPVPSGDLAPAVMFPQVRPYKRVGYTLDAFSVSSRATVSVQAMLSALVVIVCSTVIVAPFAACRLALPEGAAAAR
jgi:hypothetical protein